MRSCTLRQALTTPAVYQIEEPMTGTGKPRSPNLLRQQEFVAVNPNNSWCFGFSLWLKRFLLLRTRGGSNWRDFQFKLGQRMFSVTRVACPVQLPVNWRALWTLPFPWSCRLPEHAAGPEWGVGKEWSRQWEAMRRRNQKTQNRYYRLNHREVGEGKRTAKFKRASSFNDFPQMSKYDRTVKEKEKDYCYDLSRSQYLEHKYRNIWK